MDTPLEILGLLTGWLQGDFIPHGYPLPTLLYALQCAHKWLIRDGLAAALVSEIIQCLGSQEGEEGACSLASAWGLAEILGLQRLQDACANYAASHLGEVLGSHGFEELLMESSQSVGKREEFDSVPVLDALKSRLWEEGNHSGVELVDKKAASLGFKLRR
jgi:hypothetical protein